MSQPLQHRRRHVEVEPAFVGIEEHRDDPVAIAGQGALRCVVPVLYRVADRREEPREVAEARERWQEPIAVALDHEHVLRLVGLQCAARRQTRQVDPKCRPAWQRRIEKRDGEVAGDPAVREPDVLEFEFTR